MEKLLFLRYQVLESTISCENEQLLDLVWKLLISEEIERS